MKISSVCFMLFCLVCESICQAQVENKIDKEGLKKSIQSLTTGTFANRQTGSTGQRQAARFIAERFKNLGLIGYDSSGYFQKINLVNNYWGDVYLKSGNRILRNFDAMISMGHVVQNRETEMTIVFGGNGSDEQLNQINVEGKLVFLFADNLRSYYSIAQKMKSKKALGVILANPKLDNQFESLKKTFRDHVLQKRFSVMGSSYGNDTIKYIHEFIVPNAEVKTVMGVSINELEKFITSNTISSCPSSTIQIKCEKVIVPVETENVIGILKGTGEHSILLSAHYDTFNHEGENPGADDNASGIATLFEFAEELSFNKTLPFNIIFLATTGEEDGLIGSRFYANSTDFASRKFLYNLNIDMIGRADDKHRSNQRYLYAVGNHTNASLDSAIHKAANLFTACDFDYTYYNSKDNSFQNRGDHASFAEKGIPSIMFFGGVHADYHKATDTYSMINYKLLENRARLIHEVLRELMVLNQP